MKSQFLVSVIIPIYNVAPYIERCLLSVITQTYDALEIVLIDDCGVDDSMKIAESTLQNVEHLRIVKILHHEKNRGLSAARNTGIMAATGRYLFFLDSDDWIKPDCIQQMVERIVLYPKSQIVFAGPEVSTGEHKCLDYTQKHLPDYSANRDWLQLSMLQRTAFGMTAWNKLISTDFILTHHLQFAEGLIHEDELWNLQLAQHIEYAAFISDNTYIYCIRPDGITKQADLEERWVRHFILWDKMLTSIQGYKTQRQALALFQYIIRETRNPFPRAHSIELSCLLFRLSRMLSFSQFLLMLFQALLALIKHNKYNNRIIVSKLKPS